ncbi:hypothetical protein DM01DRAFT_1406905 [Hesseltinella vesiculosa]|uniref:BHLH domain-containing protein n=1 Tax=Hesseltinella vesiculosa TaxID=101127 RepID=A0A1X2GK93_9FUNG|nr:hypothetical protein DM01DRAFT_1406905 [Hesseltinella vesiculosa]
MDYPSSDWLYSQHEPLQEPVPFEDFQVSFGLEPGFSMPMPSDLPPPMPPSLQHNDLMQDGEPMDSLPLLDENDQRAFSQFLDAFFVDNDAPMETAEQMASQFSSYYDAPPPPLSLDDDEFRRSNILHSLDQQKQLHQRLNRVVQQQARENPLLNNLNPTSTSDPHPMMSHSFHPHPATTAPHSNAIFLQQGHQVAAPFIGKPAANHRYHHSPYPLPTTASSPPSQSLDSPSSPSYRGRPNKNYSSSTRRIKHKELLTEEEKRNNHIASEQKRRSTIRNGFKDLTDIVPTLKNINNSKSTVLFKAVDYIKYLEKRNKNLRDKISGLEVRVKVEGRVNNLLMAPSYQQDNSPSSTSSASSASAHSLVASLPTTSSHRHLSSTSQPPTTYTPSRDIPAPTINNDVSAVLKAHKAQQNQLLALQEQLQYHQQLLARQQDIPLASSSSTSSSSHSSPQSADLYQSRWPFDNAASTKKVKMEPDGPVQVTA